MMRKLARLSLLLFALCSSPFAVPGQDNRAADRSAIKAHIESIFQAFIDKDNAALRAKQSMPFTTNSLLGFQELM